MSTASKGGPCSARVRLPADRLTRSTIDLAELGTEVHLLQLQLHTERGPVVKRFYME